VWFEVGEDSEEAWARGFAEQDWFAEEVASDR
jgi:hypothetical protein